jgi:hypothetical protein
MSVQVKCTYDLYSNDFWPEHKRCCVEYLDLTLANNNKTFLFNGSNVQKSEVTEIYFKYCGYIDFIPLNIFREFPNLNGISILYSSLPTIGEIFVNPEFQKLKYLSLVCSRIQNIEVDAFAEMLDLIRINLYGNEIENIQQKIFKNNLQLKYVDLNENYLKILNPKLFNDLNNLQEIRINDSTFKSSDGSLATMNEAMKRFYDNYLVSRTTITIRELEELKNISQKLNFVQSKYNQAVQELKDAERIQGNIETLRNSESTTDVTLELNDGQSMKAHRCILEGNFLF